jgi:HK97 family phage portal protein
MSLATRVRRWFVGDTSQRDASFDALAEAVRSRHGSAVGSVVVTQDTALRHSAVWAALRLRANLESSLPVDGFRKVDGVQIEAPLSPFFEEPAGADTFLDEWMWATRFDLDRYGVTAGIVTERDGLGLPRTIELLPAGSVRIKGTGWRIEEVSYRGQNWADDKLKDVYLEHQNRPAGFPVGLCPIAYAAWTIGGYLSAQQFGSDYFGRRGFPSGVLKNTERTLPGPAAAAAKAAWKAATEGGDIAAVGKEWEWTPADAPAAATAFLEEKKAGVVEVARYLDVPADMIDGAVSGSSITYANITQRNVQLLVTSLGPAIARRERRLSRLLSRPRFVKLNSDALLRMDPETRAKVLNDSIKGFRLAPSEARALDNRQPFTEEQYVEFERLGLTKQSQGGGSADANGVPA